MNLLQVKLLILFFLSTTFANNLKLCCPFRHQYNIENESCSPMLNENSSDNFTILIYNSTTEVKQINASALNIINYRWCRTEEGLRDISDISAVYYIQENSQIYLPNEPEEYIKSGQFCLGFMQDRELYAPIICRIKESELQDTEHITEIQQTIPGNCECNTTSEQSKLSRNYCVHWFEDLHECVKCTIESTCNNVEECKLNISFIEFVNASEGNKYVVQVDKQYCPFWNYTYILNENNTVHIQILNQTCSEPISTTTITSTSTITNPSTTTTAGTLFYVGVAIVFVVFLGLLAIIGLLIRRKTTDAANYAAFIKNVVGPETTEMNPMYRPATALYKVPDEINFN